VLFADPQSPSGIVGGRRWLVAKDVNEGSETQCMGEGVNGCPSVSALLAAARSSRAG
jgi:hypothetical protein